MGGAYRNGLRDTDADWMNWKQKMIKFNLGFFVEKTFFVGHSGPITCPVELECSQNFITKSALARTVWECPDHPLVKSTLTSYYWRQGYFLPIYGAFN